MHAVLPLEVLIYISLDYYVLGYLSNRSGLIYLDAIAVWCIVIKVYRVLYDLCSYRVSI